MKQLTLLMLFFVMAGSVSAMKINEDPRAILSFLDKSLSPELDILRVTTDVTPDNDLVFQIKTKGEWINEKSNNFLLLSILHEKAYALLIPLNNEKYEKVLIYESDLQSADDLKAVTFKESEQFKTHTGFIARQINRGAEFIVPLDWINFGADFSYDAYTVEAEIQGDILEIDNIYDQARKGRSEMKQISAITLLNQICSPKK